MEGEIGDSDEEEDDDFKPDLSLLHLCLFFYSLLAAFASQSTEPNHGFSPFRKFLLPNLGSSLPLRRPIFFEEHPGLNFAIPHSFNIPAIVLIPRSIGVSTGFGFIFISYMYHVVVENLASDGFEFHSHSWSMGFQLHNSHPSLFLAFCESSFGYQSLFHQILVLSLLILDSPWFTGSNRTDSWSRVMVFWKFIFVSFSVTTSFDPLSHLISIFEFVLFSRKPPIILTLSCLRETLFTHLRLLNLIQWTFAYGFYVYVECFVYVPPWIFEGMIWFDMTAMDSQNFPVILGSSFCSPVYSVLLTCFGDPHYASSWRLADLQPTTLLQQLRMVVTLVFTSAFFQVFLCVFWLLLVLLVLSLLELVCPTCWFNTMMLHWWETRIGNGAWCVCFGYSSYLDFRLSYKGVHWLFWLAIMCCPGYSKISGHSCGWSASISTLTLVSLLLFASWLLLLFGCCWVLKLLWSSTFTFYCIVLWHMYPFDEVHSCIALNVTLMQ